MQIGTLRELLNKCNPRLHIDTDNEACYSDIPDYPTGGLYIKEMEGTGLKYIMGVPHRHVPEYTLAAVNFTELEYMGKQERIEEILKTGFALEEERLLWRGWRAIANNLIRMGYINKEKAQRVFNTHFEPQRTQLPRNYINIEF